MASKSITEQLRKSETDEKTYTLIDSHWVVQKQLPTFRIPNAQDVSSSGSSQWLEDMNTLISYYSNILTSPFDKFWVEVGVLVQCDFRDPKRFAFPKRFVDSVSQLYALVLLILLRASKSTESKDMFLRSFEHENIIYNGAVFDIPCLIDLAVLYGNGFPDIVTTIFRSVFGTGGKFADDAVLVICRATTVFEQIEKGVSGWQFDDRHQFTSSNSDAVDIVSETIDYITNAGRSLGIFLTFLGPINPSIAEFCIQRNVISSLANFYGTTIATIRDHILRNMTWSTEKKSVLLNKLAIAAAALVKTVRVGLVEPGLVHRIMQMTFDGSDASSNQSLMEATNTLIAVMMDMLNHPEFAKAYARLYPVDDEIILIRENANSISVDKDQLEYLRNAFSRLFEESSAELVNSDGAKKVAPPPVEEMLRGTMDEEPQPGPSRPPQFLAVKAVLPATNDDLIERCLEYYNNDSQSAITALLDGSVPLSVSDPDSVKQMTQYRPDQLWQGKRQNDVTMHPLSKEERERISQLALSVWDDDDDNPENGGDVENGGKDGARFFGERQVDLTYEDEYDDTYDLEVGAKMEPLDEEEAENAELGGAFDQPGKSQRPASPTQDAQRADRGKHSYRREPFDPQPRQNVLPIENPENIRWRRQQDAANRAMRYGRDRIIKRSGVPPQLIPLKFEKKSPLQSLDGLSNSGRGNPTKAGGEAGPSTQNGRGSSRSEHLRGHRDSRGGGGRGRASDRGGGNTYANRLKERYGAHGR
ncbi:Activating signal cointegrator 1 complex subunit [Echinococcus multilocularis]|uniref:Activating signal cointegrator 1 complex subunit n=1 Tax=Echinococcus multilocularis TaxID=6211 RepID=A0A068YB46_ECHMU|nr:Activating signal cointegrator 1 complex subunit [Echinococcus multilocularis]